MKKLSKIIKKIIIFVLGAMSFLGFVINVKAATINEEVKIDRGELGYYCVQKWNGEKWIYLTYNQTFFEDDENNRRIAYCLCPGLPGVGYVSGEKETYNVKIKEILSNEIVWRIIKNGYPYKTVEQLGLEKADDAYFATMQAINCVLRGYSLEQAKELYTPGQFAINGENLEDIQRRGRKTLDVMFNLIDVGLNGSEKRSDLLKLTVKPATEFVKNENDMYSKDYLVQASADILNYKVEKIENFPDGAYVSDEKGNKKIEFKNGEKFKIMIPKKSIKEDIKGKITVKANTKNYPVIYGASVLEGYQDYALCSYEYSEVNETIEMSEFTNKSKIVINKVDNDTKKPIENAKFEIINSKNDKVVLSTNNKGQIVLANQYPGKVQIKEIEAADGYRLDSELKEVVLGFNETKEIIISNELKKGSIKIIKVDKDNNEIKLQGVKFQISSINGNFKEEGITNEKGELIFNNILQDDYKIIELETIEGYEKNNDEYIVEIKDNEVNEFIIENKKIVIKEEKNVEKELPKTGMDNMYIGKIIISFIICAMCLVYILNIKK